MDVYLDDLRITEDPGTAHRDWAARSRARDEWQARYFASESPPRPDPVTRFLMRVAYYFVSRRYPPGTMPPASRSAGW